MIKKKWKLLFIIMNFYFYGQLFNEPLFYRFHKYSKVEVAKMKRWGLLPQEYDPLEVLARLGIPQQVLNDVKFSCNIDNLTLEEVNFYDCFYQWAFYLSFCEKNVTIFLIIYYNINTTRFK